MPILSISNRIQKSSLVETELRTAYTKFVLEMIHGTFMRKYARNRLRRAIAISSCNVFVVGPRLVVITLPTELLQVQV